jgi:hypothetical protein
MMKEELTENSDASMLTGVPEMSEPSSDSVSADGSLQVSLARALLARPGPWRPCSTSHEHISSCSSSHCIWDLEASSMM